ncbi:dynein axonemal heavy chain 12-like isoform X1 [Conger conger]|uniref:dynein axonemal heavy chain 12-like isoform X1 n=1 Tax=Conger conger TaxID=82655 RepID=UPI002A59FE11|nr:dynein axonemal heavy chain 12-like isoform X1 [Conger conger]XP_061114570.1 dynein axonemal heavy chain 12-like isoform X1 [Conger conger]XP_061114571.1 dynein axonemal heavy chain 12-like isoform X1 [Conger conger]
MESDGEDEEMQLMIERSLLDCTKRGGCGGGPVEDESSPPDAATATDRIFTAIRTGDVEMLAELWAVCGASAGTDSRGWSPLHQAATQSSRSILQATFSAAQQGAGQSRTLRGETPLFLTIERGLIANASFLLQNGCSPNTPNEEQDSPLISAVKHDQYDAASLLLSFGADVNQAGQHGRAPLHEASDLGRDGLVQLLLQAGAQLDPLSAYSRTPLALAAHSAHLSVVHTLLQRGAQVNAQAQDSASVLFEAAGSGNPDIITLLLEYGADANLPNRTGHLPIHRAAHRGHLLALERLIPVTRQDVVKQSGMSPLHSAADGGYPQCLELLLNAGYDANHMLHQRVRCNYDDQRKSALYFAVSNGDVSSCRLLLRAGAMPNQDPVSCLQVALRMGNYELIDTLLRHGAHVNFSSRVNPTLFPSGLQYALRDQPMLRMLLNHGYDAQRCFHCPYADAPHLPLDYEGWGPSVIRDTPFCEVITVCWLKDFAAQVVRILLDYVGHVTFCSKLKSVLEDKEQWPEICFIQGSVRSLKHLCRLRIRGCMARRRFSAPVFASCLPLPTILKDYILFSEYDLYGRGSLE